MTTYAEFETAARARGYQEVLERRWNPGQQTGTHTHPFDVDGLVTEGEFWLSVGEQTQHLRAGDRFQLAREVPHAERYGTAGAVVWVARRS